MRQKILTPSDAETIAAQALLFLSSDTDRLERFMSLSGVDVENLRRNAQDRATLTGILDYLLSDESLVLDFAEFAGMPPETPAAAWRALGGGQEL